jgi:hypothetical protein
MRIEIKIEEVSIVIYDEKLSAGDGSTYFERVKDLIELACDKTINMLRVNRRIEAQDE